MLPIDMACATRSPTTRSLTWAAALSLIVHGVVLFFPRQEPTRLRAMSSRFEATLSPTPQAARPRPTASSNAAPATYTAETNQANPCAHSTNSTEAR
jgi:hypothetical protein